MIDKKLAGEILDAALSTGGDFAEVFWENAKGQSIMVEEKKIKNIGGGLSAGVGIRVFKDYFQTYAYTNLLDRESLLQAAKKAAHAIKGKSEQRIINLADLEFEDKHQIKISPESLKKSDRAAKLLEISDYMYNLNPLVKRAGASDTYSIRHIGIANSEGVWAEDRQVRTRVMLDALVNRDEKTEWAMEGNIGGLFGAEVFENYDFKKISEDVVRRAVNKLDAELCPSGKMPVIIHNGFGGVIFHEACGHSLEATTVAPGTSVFSKRKGEMIASELVTAVDDTTIANAWGSINIDDEGTPVERKVLIENGILKNYMVDKFNGRKMGEVSNGAGRRENYKYIPTSRMSNTLILNGKSTFEEIISNTEYGLFAAKMAGGSVNPATGEFNFSVDDGFIVKNGKIKQQVKGAKLIGRGEEILKNIDMVGNNMSYSIGVCSSLSGRIPTTVGQPTLRVKEITVGGQK